MLTVQSSHVSSNAIQCEKSQYDEMVTWTKVLSPENWPEFPTIAVTASASTLFGESEIQLMAERLNVDDRQAIRAFREFKENGEKRILTNLKPLLQALKTIHVCTA